MAKSKKEELENEEAQGNVVDTETGEVSKPTKKQRIKKKAFSLDSYRAKSNIVEVKYKPQEWIDMSDAFKDGTKLPGIPIGHITMNYGKSDVGKTTMLVEAGANAIEQGIVPILIITENKFSWDRAETMGLYEDMCIVHNVDTIEDGWEVCRYHISRMESGEFQKETGAEDAILLWDSIGATPSKAELETSDHNAESLKKIREAEAKGGKVPKDTSKNGGMMVTSRVLREKFTRDLSSKINQTRKETCPYNLTMLIVNHAYTAPPSPPSTISTLKPYGGDAIWLCSSLVFRMGGVLSNSSQVKATKDGATVSFAIKSALVVEKNHISNIQASSKILCTDHGFIKDDPKVIDAYKAEHRGEWELEYDKYWNSVDEY